MKEKKRGLKRIGKGILLAILVLAALIYAPFWDTAPPDVADLAVVRVEVPPEENAYTFFLQATNSLRRIADFSLSQYLQGLTNDEALVSAALATNQAVIARIRLGVERRYCQLPIVEDWKPDVFSSYPLSAFMDIGTLVAAQVRFERLQGRTSEATDACLLLLRFGRRLSTASNSIVDYLIANAIVERGLGQADDLTRDKRCGPKERERLAAGLAELSSSNEGLINAAKGDYLIGMQILEKMRTGDAYRPYVDYWFENRIKRALGLMVTRAVCFPNYFMQYNRTRHLMVDDFRLLIAHASSSYVDHPLRKRDSALYANGKQGMVTDSIINGQRPFLHRDQHRHLLYANALGHRLWQNMSDVLESLVKTTCRQECALSGVRLLLACRAYEEAMGRLPETLENLVPDYLPAVPRDPFDGSPFRYSAERRLVYSIGENLVDDGGTDGRKQGRRRARDLLFELER